MVFINFTFNKNKFLYRPLSESAVKKSIRGRQHISLYSYLER